MSARLQIDRIGKLDAAAADGLAASHRIASQLMAALEGHAKASE